MKFRIAVVTAALVLAPLAMAQAAGNPKVKSMMTQDGCFACHAISHKVVGPAYSWVAARYKNATPKTVKMLAEHVIKGGAGHWNKWTGGVPMSPNALDMKQAEAAVHWVLAQKPVKAPAP